MFENDCEVNNPMPSLTKKQRENFIKAVATTSVKINMQTDNGRVGELMGKMCRRKLYKLWDEIKGEAL